MSDGNNDAKDPDASGRDDDGNGLELFPAPLKLARGLVIFICVTFLLISLYGGVMIAIVGWQSGGILAPLFVALQIGGMALTMRHVRRSQRTGVILGVGLLAAMLWTMSVGLCMSSMAGIDH